MLGMSNQTQNPTINMSLCYLENRITSKGIWAGDSPWNFTITSFIFQSTIIILTSRLIGFLLKPFHQPRVISEILGGIILGPSVLGNYGKFAEKVFPLNSVMMLERMANLGLLYFLFLVGVRMDANIFKRTKKRAVIMAFSASVFPFLMAASSSLFFKDAKITKDTDKGSLILFMGMVVSVTAFPVLARILANLKLLNSEIGRLAMSVALISDMIAWILLAFTTALIERHTSTWAVVGPIFGSIAYILFCVFGVRPLIYRIIKCTPEGGYISDRYICLILTGVLIGGFITDSIGTHSILGSFVFGLVIPEGQLGAALVEKLEDFVTGLLLPLFFAISGLRTNIPSLFVKGSFKWVYLLIVQVLCAIAKVLVTLIVGLFYQMTFQEGISLGLMMNTKGLIEIVILNVGREQKVLDDQSFATMLLLTVVLTGLVTPAVMAIYRPSRRVVPYKCRTVQKSKPDSELRMLTCIHTARNVPAIINILQASNPSKKTPICVYALYLKNLTGRQSEMLVIHTQPEVNHSMDESRHIFNALDIYAQDVNGLSINPITVISPYSTMHEDICNVAEDKRTALIIIPFHKQQAVDGGMELTNSSIRSINQNILANAPCSVGILVDRGLGSFQGVRNGHSSHHIAVLFFAGPDDREALSYASRMVEHPGITLTLLRFMPGDKVVEPTIYPGDDNDMGILTVTIDNDKEKQIDDEFINAVRMKNMGKNSINYIEKVVNNGEDTVSAIRSTDTTFELFIVGRGQGMISPLTAGLTDWSECPELGAIGDLLASSDFAAIVSVLVVQQYVGMGTHVDGIATPDSLGNRSQTDHSDSLRHANQRIGVGRGA